MRTCIVCQRDFENKKHPEQQACGKACAAMRGWATRDAKGKGRGRRHPIITCEICGKTAPATTYIKTKTCSLACAGKQRSRDHTPKNPKWTEFVPGITWKAGRKDEAGYIRIYLPQHPNAKTKGDVFEHRVVVEQHIGRFLESWEKVHHRNAVKDDNRIENLEIVTQARPNGVVICPHCRKSFQVH